MSSVELLNRIKEQVIVAILGDDELGDHLVLKGGNLLQFAYQLTTRASKDVDISVDGEFPSTQALGDRVKTCLETTFARMKMVVIDFEFEEVPARISDDLKSFWGGYKCEFKLIEQAKYEANKGNIENLRRHAQPLDGNSPRFKVDFSRHEFCEDKEDFVIDGYTIRGYSPRMFVSEKLRAICQQMPEYGPIVHRGRPASSRARDFVDIHVIAEHYGIDFADTEFHEIVGKTFKAKKVPIDWLGRIKDTRDQHEPDFQSVRDTVAPAYRNRLQEFDFYFQFVCDGCSRLEPLWNI
jgi:hypothetical protein